MTPNLACMFLAMTGSAMHKNRNSTLFCFWIIPLWLILKSISCSEHNFFTIGWNDSILGKHVSGNNSKCSAQEPYLYLVPFLIIPLWLIFIEHFLSWALLCHQRFKWLQTCNASFWQWLKSAWHKNFNSTLFLFSSPEHKVLKVSFCDGPLSVVHRPCVRACVRQQFL